MLLYHTLCKAFSSLVVTGALRLKTSTEVSLCVRGDNDVYNHLGRTLLLVFGSSVIYKESPKLLSYLSTFSMQTYKRETVWKTGNVYSNDFQELNKAEKK